MAVAMSHEPQGPQEERETILKSRSQTQMTLNKYGGVDERSIGDFRRSGMLSMSDRSLGHSQHIPTLSMGQVPGMAPLPVEAGGMEVGYHREIKSLLHIIEKQKHQLSAYQKQLGIQIPEINYQALEREDPTSLNDYPLIMNSYYYLNPLLLAYDDHLYNLEREMKAAKLNSLQMSDKVRNLTLENEMITRKYQQKANELSKLLEENQDHLAGRLLGDQVVEEKQTLEERCALLSEENQILLDQLTTSKEELERINNLIHEKLGEAEGKIGKFNELYVEYKVTQEDLSKLVESNKFLEEKVEEMALELGSVEQALLIKDRDLHKSKTDLALHSKQHLFYKTEYEECTKKREDEVKYLNDMNIELGERKKEALRNCNELEEFLKMKNGDVKALKIDLASAKQDLGHMIRISDEFQQKYEQLIHKEDEMNERAHQFRDELESIKLEREKMIIIEQKYQRQIEKLKEDGRTEIRERSERYEKIIKSSKQAQAEKLVSREEEIYGQKLRIDELEDKLSLVSTESNELGSKVQEHYKREADLQNAHNRQMDALKMQMNEKERELRNSNAKLEQAQIILEKRETELAQIEEEYNMQHAQIINEKNQMSYNLENLQQEHSTLNGELRAQKEINHNLKDEMISSHKFSGMKVGGLESDYERKIFELQQEIQRLNIEKSDAEKRSTDILRKYEVVKGKYEEEHHQTVTYFENIVGGLKRDLVKSQGAPPTHDE